MAHQVGLAGRVFSTLGRTGVSVELISQGASEINISVVVDQEDEFKAIQAIHKEFLEPASSD